MMTVMAGLIDSTGVDPRHGPGNQHLAPDIFKFTCFLFLRPQPFSFTRNRHEPEGMVEAGVEELAREKEPPAPLPRLPDRDRDYPATAPVCTV
jgi:hypothetical protein